MNGSVAVRKLRIDSFEHLCEATPSSNSEIVQLERGTMNGSLIHLAVAGVSMGAGAFSHGLLSRGVYSGDRVTVGLLLQGRSGPFSANPGEIAVWSPGAEHENRYYGAASFMALSFSMTDVEDFLKDARLTDASILLPKKMRTVAGLSAQITTQMLRETFECMCSTKVSFSDDEAEFWKQSMLSTVTDALASALPKERDAFITSPARLVRRAQDFLESEGTRSIHVTELVAEVGVSRRTLHRAFEEVLGIGPMELLRYRRLCSARRMLKEQIDLTVAEVSLRHGFSDVGRFSGYYRKHFGEYPSKTRRRGN